MTAVTRWWWVRHAPVTSNEGRIYGQQDLPCDCSDEDLFKHVADMLPQDAICITSNLQRTHQTADALEAGGLKFSARIEEADFREQSFGDWQGVTYADFDTLRDGIAHRYWLAPAIERPPAGESFVDLMARVGPAITKHSNAFEGKDIIAVTHGGTIRSALGIATNCGAEAALAYSVENVSVTRLDHIQGEDTTHWRLGFINWLPRRHRDEA
ncbi:histidine phosphatase family protein [Curvivirga sp.]|uniref:histidine phosphatase family protein n=1 Tax=Curvivirga sp. TaxID=2856848 RepID=UPI003B5C23CC